MKKILVSFCLILLVSCKSFNAQEIQMELKKVAIKESKEKYSHNKKYYSFYLDPSISVVESNDSSNIFYFQNNYFSLNINLSKIMHKHYFKDTKQIDNFEKNNAVLNYNDIAINSKNEEFEYNYQLFKFNDRYLIKIESEEFLLEAFSQQQQVLNLSKKMLNILKTCNIKEEKVLENFSLKYTITNKRKQVDLFKVLLPSTISLEEILKNSNEYYQDINE